jgi:simple sugar transport system ATP-binding protein
MNTTPALSLRDIQKTYPGVKALNKVDFSLQPGEVRALLGKNGAGKSTLIRIACGLEKPDEGSIHVRGKSVVLKNPSEAQEKGIALVSQELSIIPWFSVAENISLGRWPKKGGRLDRKEMHDRASDALERLGVEINPNALLVNLSPAQQQLVEIARALSRDPSVLLLDEPTSSLAQPEVDALIKTVKHIASQGVAIVYVSHRLSEISQVANSVTILRNGELVITAPINELTDQDIVGHMVGDIVEFKDVEEIDIGSEPIILSVENLSIPKRVKSISFDLHKGEVLGLAGMLGTGRSEILRAIAGFDQVEKGNIDLITNNGDKYRPSIQHMIQNGVAYCPEDRRIEGIIPYLGVDENITIGRWKKLRKAIKISWNTVRDITFDLIKRLSIKTPKVDTPIMNLSGGNQQKVVIGRWLDIANRVLLLDEPTRGVDVEAKGQIFDIIQDAAERGVGVIVVASELEELLLCCQSVIFLHGGEASRKYSRSELNMEKLNTLAHGGTLQS